MPLFNLSPETKLFWKYLGIITLIIVVLFLVMTGESIINNLLEPLKHQK